MALTCVLAGCATTQSLSCHNNCVPSGCGEPASASECSETCEPLLLSAACTSDPGECCSDGCAAEEGCCGCTGEGDRRRRKGLEGGFVRGKKNIVLDGAGWIVGIPNKLLLWNTKVDSHSVSAETEQQLRRYMTSRGLDDVKVRINQYDPFGEWKRLVANKAIHPGWRYTVGAFAVTKYTLIPGRLVGNDEYNPFTNSISLYSDRASIALREGAHARQALEATYPGLWAASTYIPASPLWIDTPAIREVLAWSGETNQRALQRESYLVLFPSYGARIGSSGTFFLDAAVGQATQAGFALVGHAVGRTMAFRVSEGPMEMVKSVYGIVKKRPEQEDVWDAESDQTVELQNPLPDAGDFDVTLVPLDVIYNSLQ